MVGFVSALNPDDTISVYLEDCRGAVVKTDFPTRLITIYNGNIALNQIISVLAYKLNNQFHRAVLLLDYLID